MKKLFAISALFLLQACSSSVVEVDPAASQVIAGDSVVYIAQFTGSHDDLGAATGYFAAELKQQISNRIVVGAAADPVAEALADASKNGADLLITGHVAGHQTTGALQGFATVEVYAVQSGDRIANFHRPSGDVMVRTVNQAIMAAVKRTATDVGALFD